MSVKVSVIIPVLNRETLIERCLDSILNQKSAPYEIIVVDNGSTDGTYEVVEKWMQKHCDSDIKMQLLKEECKGTCRARQKGLENATGDYLIFFDSDDIMRSSLIAEALNVVEKNKGTDIVCWKVCIHTLNGKRKIPSFHPERALESHLIDALLRTQGYMIRKSFLEKAGGWSKPIHVWNDFELGLRLLLQKPDLRAVHKVLVDIYSQKDSITGISFSSKEGEWENTLQEMEKMVEQASYPSKDKIQRVLNYRRIILAATYYKEGNISGANKLRREAIKKADNDKFLLEFSYNYTKRGFRGVWHLLRHLYNLK